MKHILKIIAAMSKTCKPTVNTVGFFVLRAAIKSEITKNPLCFGRFSLKIMYR